MREGFSGPYAVVTMGMILVIIYGSLYPFDFSIPATGPGAVEALIGSWANRPSRGDFLANVLLYTPVGFFGGLAFSRRTALLTRFLGTALLGAVLSISMELTQYYDIGRDTGATDGYANVLGTLLGAIPGVVFQGDHRWLLVRQIVANRIPALLVLTWVAYRLYPYVPTINLHKYWDTLKPIVLTPKLSAYDLFRHTAIWLTVYTLVSRITTILRPWLLMPLWHGEIRREAVIARSIGGWSAPHRDCMKTRAPRQITISRLGFGQTLACGQAGSERSSNATGPRVRYGCRGR